nr:MAG TPA: hypothetical protein [Caudoviricetes sp.]
MICFSSIGCTRSISSPLSFSLYLYYSILLTVSQFFYRTMHP